MRWVKYQTKKMSGIKMHSLWYILWIVISRFSWEISGLTINEHMNRKFPSETWMINVGDNTLVDHRYPFVCELMGETTLQQDVNGDFSMKLHATRSLSNFYEHVLQETFIKIGMSPRSCKQISKSSSKIHNRCYLYCDFTALNLQGDNSDKGTNNAGFDEGDKHDTSTKCSARTKAIEAVCLCKINISIFHKVLNMAGSVIREICVGNKDNIPAACDYNIAVDAAASSAQNITISGVDTSDIFSEVDGNCESDDANREKLFECKPFKFQSDEKIMEISFMAMVLMQVDGKCNNIFGIDGMVQFGHDAEFFQIQSIDTGIMGIYTSIIKHVHKLLFWQINQWSNIYESMESDGRNAGYLSSDQSGSMPVRSTGNVDISNFSGECIRVFNTSLGIEAVHVTNINIFSTTSNENRFWHMLTVLAVFVYSILSNEIECCGFNAILQHSDEKLSNLLKMNRVMKNWLNMSFGKSLIMHLLMSVIIVMGNLHTAESKEPYCYISQLVDDHIANGNKIMLGNTNKSSGKIRRTNRSHARRNLKIKFNPQSIYQRRHKVRDRLKRGNLQGRPREPASLAPNDCNGHVAFQISIPTRLRVQSLELLFQNENFEMLQTNDLNLRQLNALVNDDETDIGGYILPNCARITDFIISVHRITKEILRCTFTNNQAVFIREVAVENFNAEIITKWSRLIGNVHVAKLGAVIRYRKKILILFEASDKIFNWELPWNESAMNRVLNEFLVVKYVIKKNIPEARLYASSIGCDESGGNFRINFADVSTDYAVAVSNIGIGTFLTSVLLRTSLENSTKLVSGKCGTDLAIMLSSNTRNDISDIMWLIVKLLWPDVCIEIFDLRRGYIDMFKICALDKMMNAVVQAQKLLQKRSGPNPNRRLYEIRGNMLSPQSNVNDYVMKDRLFVTCS